jgi:hypothetical protein
MKAILHASIAMAAGVGEGAIGDRAESISSSNSSHCRWYRAAKPRAGSSLREMADS